MKAEIQVWQIEEVHHPYPWRFSISMGGHTWKFAGIPNQCATKRAATMRARWRAKWLEAGTFGDRYK